MSLFDSITPSARAADLTLVVRRLKKLTGSSSVPIVVVEGPSDETLLGTHCSLGSGQVFAAGTRGLVEQMLVFMRNNPVPDCDCVFLTDCDAKGKATSLKHESDLIVTEGCDIEADMVSLGVAARVVAQMTGAVDRDFISRAIEMSLPLSYVRRRAERARVTMKRSQRRLRLIELDRSTLERWSGSPPLDVDVVQTVASKLEWTHEERTSVLREDLEHVTPDFRLHASGKDVLDALWFLLDYEGFTHGVTVEAFHRKIMRSLEQNDLSRWEVGRRLQRWQESLDVRLIEAASTL